jgi:hypothetical protein
VMIGLFAYLGAIFVGSKIHYPVLFCAACVSYDFLIPSVANETATCVGSVLVSILAIGSDAGGYSRRVCYVRSSRC